MACRTCRYYDVERVKDKIGRIRSNRAADCLWRAPDIDWPASMPEFRTPFPHMAMEPDDGENCKAYRERS